MVQEVAKFVAVAGELVERGERVGCRFVAFDQTGDPVDLRAHSRNSVRVNGRRAQL
jgi:hypothetical protein